MQTLKPANRIRNTLSPVDTEAFMWPRHSLPFHVATGPACQFYSYSILPPLVSPPEKGAGGGYGKAASAVPPSPRPQEEVAAEMFLGAMGRKKGRGR